MLAILVMLAGTVSVLTLPIAQYPAIAPAIAITANYPGASAKTSEGTVTQIIEQKMKGLDRPELYGVRQRIVGVGYDHLTFENGTNPDTAQVQVQNKLSLAACFMEVTAAGIHGSKSAITF